MVKKKQTPVFSSSDHCIHGVTVWSLLNWLPPAAWTLRKRTRLFIWPEEQPDFPLKKYFGQNFFQSDEFGLDAKKFLSLGKAESQQGKKSDSSSPKDPRASSGGKFVRKEHQKDVLSDKKGSKKSAPKGQFSASNVTSQGKNKGHQKDLVGDTKKVKKRKKLSSKRKEEIINQVKLAESQFSSEFDLCQEYQLGEDASEEIMEEVRDDILPT